MINTLILYSIFNILLFYTITKLSYKLNFLDLPDERKIHSKATAYTGGIIISISLLASLEIFKLFNYINPNLNLIFSIAFLISLVGLTDDKFNLNAGGKLSLQIIPIFYLVVLENISLQSIGNYEYFSLDLEPLYYPLDF